MGTSRVDLGAAFIHGCDASYNPVFKLATELGVKVDQTAGGYSGGWGQNAPWFDSSTGRRLSRAHVNKVWAWVVAAKALMDTTPLRKMHQWEASLAEQRERFRASRESRRALGQRAEAALEGELGETATEPLKLPPPMALTDYAEETVTRLRQRRKPPAPVEVEDKQTSASRGRQRQPTSAAETGDEDVTVVERDAVGPYRTRQHGKQGTAAPSDAQRESAGGHARHCVENAKQVKPELAEDEAAEDEAAEDEDEAAEDEASHHASQPMCDRCGRTFKNNAARGKHMLTCGTVEDMRVDVKDMEAEAEAHAEAEAVADADAVVKAAGGAVMAAAPAAIPLVGAVASSEERPAAARNDADDRDGEGTAELPPLAVQRLEWDSAAAEEMVATATAQITVSVAARVEFEGVGQVLAAAGEEADAAVAAAVREQHEAEEDEAMAEEPVRMLQYSQARCFSDTSWPRSSSVLVVA
ncbi:polyamine oxidase [Chrysochromulina tobinii]|uniref:Polyamine oxidase n=1 Tax=Chrysochromulina tobinii TaxID=1460289 RepID=A0A0M0JYX0_9EUKA|nr:polyamine oxidase [Chrysochromulina tobinii]|eukprot:KOO31851.1 polyamine oxidase [Chrysochromulina sp. CCMP291]